MNVHIEADSPHGLLSKGHCCCEVGVLIHLSIQCMWKICWHLPNTVGWLLSIRKRLAITREGLTERTIVSRELTISTARVVCDSTDTADVFILFLLFTQLPSPLRDSIPFFDDHPHDLTLLTLLRYRPYHLRNYMCYGGVQRRVLCGFLCFPHFGSRYPRATRLRTRRSCF